MTTPLRARPTLTAVPTAIAGLSSPTVPTAGLIALRVERNAILAVVTGPQTMLVAVDIADPTLSTLALAAAGLTT